MIVEHVFLGKFYNTSESFCFENYNLNYPVEMFVIAKNYSNAVINSPDSFLQKLWIEILIKMYKSI